MCKQFINKETGDKLCKQILSKEKPITRFIKEEIINK